MSQETGLVSEGGYPWDLQPYNKIARFLTSLKESKIETTKCNKCGTIQWPPRSVCAKCLSLDLSWTALPTTGKIVAFSKSYVGLIEGEEPPILVAALELDNGLRLLARISNARFEDLKVGARVKLAKTALVNGKPYWTFEPMD